MQNGACITKPVEIVGAKQLRVNASGLVNLIGGFAVGMLQRGMSPGDAINTYSLNVTTVGSGSM